MNSDYYAIVKDIFPEGVILSVKDDGADILYSLHYDDGKKIETPFGVVSEKYFSTENRDFDKCVEILQNTFRLNGYNFETKIWR